MFWSEDGNFYMVTFGNDSGTWQFFPGDASIWKDGMPQYSCTIPTPGGFYHPIRGFGGLWCQHDDIRQQIGWGLKDEAGVDDLIQEFEYGFIFRDSDGKTRRLAYILFNNEGTFIKEPY